MWKRPGTEGDGELRAEFFKRSEGQPGSENIAWEQELLWPPAKPLPAGLGLLLAIVFFFQFSLMLSVSLAVHLGCAGQQPSPAVSLCGHREKQALGQDTGTQPDTGVLGCPRSVTSSSAGSDALGNTGTDASCCSCMRSVSSEV